MGLVSSSAPRLRVRSLSAGENMVKVLLWLLLLVLCWPLALLALVAYPVVWLLLIPFRLLGFAVDGVLAFVKALFMLPARLLGGGAKA